MLRKKKKPIAIFFMLLLSTQLIVPATAHALTSGPSQPEMAKFEPAGTDNLVNLFTGDLNYNIPLLEVGGYPVNLSYKSGTSMDEESSWVGMGWTLNPGSVNRAMRGLPDDFDGTKGDKIERTLSKKEFKKVGGQIVLKPTLFAWEKNLIGVDASLKVNVYKDNYYGVGASVGAGLGFSMATNTKTPLTMGLNLDVTSDTRNGVDFSPNFSADAAWITAKDIQTAGLSGGLEYNTRSGLKSVSLSASYENHRRKKWRLGTSVGYQSNFGQTYTPSIPINTANSGFTFSFDLGTTFWAVHVGIGGSGYVYKEKLVQPFVSAPAFGYLNYLKGRKNENALLDFNREKDGVFITSAPSIPIPVATPDYFEVSGQAGNGQFRPYFGGNYIVFDKANANSSTNFSGGITFGGGNVFIGGARLEHTKGGAETRKWTKNNAYLSVTEAAFNTASNQLEESVYFKQVGDPAAADESFSAKIEDNETVKVAVNDRLNNSVDAKTYTVFKKRSSQQNIASPIKKTTREKRNSFFSYLTAEQADRYGLEKDLKSHNSDGVSTFERVNTHHKGHHISEITITDNGGKRMVYGIPVLNKKQEEVTFSVPAPSSGSFEEARRTGLVSYTGTPGPNQNGRDWYYSKEVMPAYTTSYLLTGVLSTDYVDVLGDGITDDDPGGAIKFNYTKLADYKWRAPYDQNKANYNEGFITDPKDDKASYVYGERETWYLYSIEGKTTIAIFETSNREDGLGVLDANGGKNTSMRPKKLDRIKLYSKPDWLENGTNAVPIKIVHFEYDYSLYPDVSNNTGTAVDKTGSTPQTPAENVNVKKGKLTLKKVWFTFGTSTRGQSNPYEFGYDERLINSTEIPNLPAVTVGDPEADDKYLERQSDRWGTYKKSFYNKIVSSQRKLNNSEFPYALQENVNTTYSERLLADRFASKWQLNKITTPAGAILTIEYESNDYAYVQNRKAMQMCFVKGVVQPNGSTANCGLINADKLAVELPRAAMTATEFKDMYLKQADGRYVDKIFYKILTAVDKEHYEYVHGYAEVDINNCTVSVDGKTAYIALKKTGGYNPVSKAAWQMLRTDLPHYAYDGYDNSDVSDDFKAAIISIVKAFGTPRELTESFEARAARKNFANCIDQSKGMVRLMNPGFGDAQYAKIGGGPRVKKLQISNEWQESTGVSGMNTAKYGQLYDYTIRDASGNFISSSGVASYEPQIGNEENPFREPIPFTEKVHWSSDRYHYIEKPYCESYFPAASIGYSKVRVTSFGDDYVQSGTLVKHTGFIDHEFYTARDFPTIVDNLPLDQTNYKKSLTLKLFAAEYVNKLVTSQGFKIELNDMHGKPRSVKVFNKGGDLISSTESFYSVKSQDAETKELKNEVDVLKMDGSIESNVSMATDIDFTTDIRQSISETIGTSIGGYGGWLMLPALIPIPIPYAADNNNKSITSDYYHSVSSVKIIHRYGILKKVRTMKHGSTTEAENLLWDEDTGQVLLTRTQNEHDKDIYTFIYPAHLVKEYEGMGGAYHNAGMLLTDPLTGTDGAIKAAFTNLQLPDGRPCLFPGDELINTTSVTPIKGWIGRGNTGGLHLYNKDGVTIDDNGTYLLVRSGRRNITSAGAGTVICMKDPRVNGEIKLDDASFRVLDAKVQLYKDQWPIAARDYFPVACNPLYLEYLNPYVTGIFGKWRSDSSFTYIVNREQVSGNPALPGGTDIRSSGYYRNYTPFWQFTPGGITKHIYPTNGVQSPDMLRWRWTSRPVFYDAYGNMVEKETSSTDPANPGSSSSHFGAALYGYHKTLLTAIGANTRLNEMFFDGFEDYYFTANMGLQCPLRRHYDLSNSGFNPFTVTPDLAHSGKYSCRFSSAMNFNFAPGSQVPIAELFEYNGPMYFFDHDNDLNDGFRPVLAKKYLLSLWVNDHSPSTNTIQNLTVKINGVNQQVNTKVVPVVEGWKKLDIAFVYQANPVSPNYELELIPTATIEIDDIRVMPYDAQMTSYAYDDITLRQSAQLDENNFATFYEYDDEGIPVRVKKETDRGIMTLKENRQSVRKRF